MLSLHKKDDKLKLACARYYVKGDSSATTAYRPNDDTVLLTRRQTNSKESHCNKTIGICFVFDMSYIIVSGCELKEIQHVVVCKRFQWLKIQN